MSKEHSLTVTAAVQTLLKKQLATPLSLEPGQTILASAYAISPKAFYSVLQPLILIRVAVAHVQILATSFSRSKDHILSVAVIAEKMLTRFAKEVRRSMQMPADVLASLCVHQTTNLISKGVIASHRTAPTHHLSGTWPTIR